jgi:DNA-binding beta-propeller fold protein YncE
VTAKPQIALFAPCLALLVALLASAPAQAHRALITEKAVGASPDPKDPIPPPEGEIEGACGVALTPQGGIYVSDYYRHAVELYRPFFQLIPVGEPPEGPCQLALDSKGNLYANLWHQSVVRLVPSFQILHEANCTGVAVDDTGLVYVNERTRIAVYEPPATLVETIGAGGALEDAYGLAVFAGRVYVADAATETVKAFDPSLDPTNPIDSIAPPSGFNSLTDGEVTVDPTNGNILVLDNLQPGYEHPRGTIDEFDEDGAFLDPLSHTVIDASPSGLAVDPGTGRLYATSGDSEEANVFVFGPYTEGGVEGEGSATETSRLPAGEAMAAVGPAEPLAGPGGSASSAAVQRSSRTLAHRRARIHRRVRHHPPRRGLSRR